MTDSRASGSDVAVLAATYRHANYETECPRAIRQQSIPPARVSIAGENPPDETAFEVTTHLDRQPRFTGFHCDDGDFGVSRMLNRNLSAMATRHFIDISVHDYMTLPQMKRYRELKEEAPEATVAYCDAVSIDGGSKVLHNTSQTEFFWPDVPKHPLTNLLRWSRLPAVLLFLRAQGPQHTSRYRLGLFYAGFQLLVRLSKSRRFDWAGEALVGVRRFEPSLGSAAHALRRTFSTLTTEASH